MRAVKTHEERWEALVNSPPAPRDVGFYPNLLIRTKLPYKNPEEKAWSFQEKQYKITLQSGHHPISGKVLPVPHGGLTRLIFSLITTQVKRAIAYAEQTNSAPQNIRRVDLGPTKRALMRALGIQAGGEALERLERALLSTFRSTITYTIFEQDTPLGFGKYKREAISNSGVVGEKIRLWEIYEEEGGELQDFGGGIVISPMMVRLITGRLTDRSGIYGAVPIDRRVFRLWRGKPFGLDVYLWLSIKAFQSVQRGRPLAPIAWKTLHERFPSSHSRRDNFRRAFIRVLRKIQTFWEGLHFEFPTGRIKVAATRMHLSRPDALSQNPS